MADYSSRPALGLLTSILISAAACPFSLPAAEDLEFSCDTDADCSEGHHCDTARKTCVAEDVVVTVDAGLADHGLADQGAVDQSAADQRVADQAIADNTVADQGIADHAVADQAIADQSLADRFAADVLVADVLVADVLVADVLIADVTFADHYVTDQSLADQSLADQASSGPISVQVPNGDFETIYKPGSTGITGELMPASRTWTQGVGPDCPVENEGEMYFAFADASTGTVAHIPGWLGYDRAGWIALGGTYDRDTSSGNRQGSVARQGNHTPGGANSYLVNGAQWGNPGGGLITSEASLGDILSDATYTLSTFASGSASPVVFHLLADGVVLTPSSSLDPVLDGYQELSRTYDAADLSGHVGQAMTIVLGVGRPDPDGATGAQTRFDDVKLSY